MPTNNESSAADREPVHRADGVTASERNLLRLCKRSFLSLWSYPSVYYAPGKELCDLLVLFQDHVLIFSDKDCKFGDGPDLHVNWCRWFRNAVLKSAHQAWGAERRIRSFPDRLHLDPECKHTFPIDLPDLTKAKFHRVLVAHGASRRCRQQFGGSGSLMLDPTVVGRMHYADAKTVKPFVIGQVDPGKGFFHVFDDTTLDILLGTLDTTADFVAYLAKKEAFIQSGRLACATGEEDLLAFYLRYLNEQGEHDFVVPPNVGRVLVDEGLWEEFAVHPQREAQVAANAVSYVWDRLIEGFNHHILNATWYDQSNATVRDREQAVRLLAAECRTVRRLLARSLLELVENSRLDQPSTRVILPLRPGGPFYIFLLLPRLPSGPEREYREVRLKLLDAYCMMVKLKFPEAKDIVGLATEAGPVSLRSEDVGYFDARNWSKEDQAEAESLQRDLGLLAQVTDMFHRNEKEYPDVPRRQHQQRAPAPRQARSVRNSPCPCGSGKKFKVCCRKRR